MNSARVIDMINENDFINTLSEEIYALIDEEMLKGDEMNCELVDSLVEALEILQGDEAQEVFGMIPFILNSKSIIKKTNVANALMKIVASAAIVSLLLTGVDNILVNATGSGIVEEISSFIQTVKEYIIPEEKKSNKTDNEVKETTTVFFEESTTLPEETTTQIQVTKGNIETPSKKEATKEPLTLPHISLQLPEETTTQVVTTTIEAEETELNTITTTKAPTTTTLPTTTTTTEPTTQEESTTQVVECGITLAMADNFKTDYLFSESLDLSGLEVFLLYTDNNKIPVSLKDITVTGFNSRLVGAQKITVHYKEFTADFTVNILKTEINNTETKTVTAIQFTKDFAYSPANSYENFLFYENVQWCYIYSDGTLSTWKSSQQLTLISEVDREEFTRPQTLTYKTDDGFEASIDIQLFNDYVPAGKQVKSVKITNRPKTMRHKYNFSSTYIYQHETVDFSEYELKITYNNNTTEIVKATDYPVGIYGDFSTEALGNQKIIFTYGTKMITDYVSVLEDTTDLISYKINKMMCIFYVDKEGYEYDEENANIKKAPAEFPYTDSLVVASIKGANDIYLEDIEIVGYDPSKIGPIEVDVYYKDKYLGSTTLGYIIGDAGFVPQSPPSITTYSNNENPTYKAYFEFVRHLGNGILERNKDTDNSIYLPNLDLLGFSHTFSGSGDNDIVYYQMESETVTGYGTHKITIPIYELKPEEVFVKPDYSFTTYSRGETAQEFSFDVEIIEAPYKLEVTMPESRMYCFDTLQEDLIDNVEVYGVYRDGRKERIYDYYYALNKDCKGQGAVYTFITFTYQMNGCISTIHSKDIYLFLYEQGFEDSFYFTLNHNVGQSYLYRQGYYTLGAKRSNLSIDFYGAGKKLISYDCDSSYNSNRVTISGFDTSTLGTRTATITVTNEIGTFTEDYTYTVVEKFVTPSLSVIVKDENYIGSRYGGVSKDNFEVYYTDFTNSTRLLEEDEYEYSYYLTNNGMSVNIKYNDGLGNGTLSFTKNFAAYGKLNSFTIFRDEESGKFGVNIDTFLEEDLKHTYRIDVYDVKGYAASLGKLKGTYYSDTPNCLIDESVLPTWKTQFYIEVTVITQLPNGEEIKSNSIMLYHNIYN